MTTPIHDHEADALPQAAPKRIICTWKSGPAFDPKPADTTNTNKENK